MAVVVGVCGFRVCGFRVYGFMLRTAYRAGGVCKRACVLVIKKEEARVTLLFEGDGQVYSR